MGPATAKRRNPPSIIHGVLRIVLLASAAAMVAGCATPSGPGSAPRANQPRRGGVVRVALSAEPSVLNPVLDTRTVNVLVSRNILEGLLKTLPDGSRAPRLAAEVPSFDNGGISQDGLTITWKLRSGVVWSDGRPFTSRDVAFTYGVNMNPANPLPRPAGYPDIASVTTPDDTTVVVTYRTLYADSKSHFLWVLPEHVFGGDTAIEGHPFNRAPLGTGPFAFKTWIPGDSIVLEPNPNYREPGKPYLDSLIFKIVPSREVGILWLKAREIEVLWGVIEAHIPEIEAMPDVVLDQMPGNFTEYLFLNASCPSGPRQGDPRCPHPVLGDLRVRQAVELAIDKRAIVDELLDGHARVATSILSTGPFATSLPPSEHNPGKARQLLEEAGWRVGRDGIRDKDGVRASLTSLAAAGDNVRQQTQELVQAQLRAVGIELNVQNFRGPLGSWRDNGPVARGNFDTFMNSGPTIIDPHPLLLNALHSSQVPTEQTPSGGNIHRIVDPELDRALEAAGATLDEAARKAAYQTVAERVDAGKGRIPLYGRLSLHAFNQRVKGWVGNIWEHFTWSTEDWWIDN